MLVSYALSRKREASITGLYRVTQGSLEALRPDMAAVLTGSDAGQLRGASVQAGLISVSGRCETIKLRAQRCIFDYSRNTQLLDCPEPVLKRQVSEKALVGIRKIATARVVRPATASRRYQCRPASARAGPKDF